MPLNHSHVRTDVGYLRRRVKPGAAAPTSAPQVEAVSPPPRPTSAGLSLAPAGSASPSAAPAGSSTPAARPAAGLSLSGTAAPASARPAVTVSPDSLPFPAPSIDEVRVLGDDKPVLRLNARESAIGSLLVSGVVFAAWEDSDSVTGSVTASGETAGSPVVTSGHRPLVGFDDDDNDPETASVALITLRHVRRLRRALLIARGADPIGVQLFDGGTVTVQPGDDSHLNVLYLVRIGNLLELRAEPVDRSASDESILDQFGFSLTPYLPNRETRSR